VTRIAIIGGGIAGLSAGAALSAEAEVTLFEAEEALGYHASGRSAALIEQNYGAPPVQALNRLSFPYLDSEGYLSPRGLMILAKTEERADFETDVAQMGLEVITTAEARALVPVLDRDAVAHAAYHAEAYDIDTDRLMQDYARSIRSAGGRVVIKAQVTGIDWLGSGWRITTSQDIFEADMLVNAAGAWADPIAELAGIAPLGIRPHRRSMARLPAPGSYPVRNWPMFFGVKERWYAKPDAGALLVSPADEDPTHPHDAWADDLTVAEGIALYQEMVTEQVTRVLKTWAGLRSFAPDRSLVLGPDPRQPAFIWCAGQGGYGMQTAPAAAQLLADLVFARPTELPQDSVAALRPERLI